MNETNKKVNEKKKQKWKQQTNATATLCGIIFAVAWCPCSATMRTV